MLAVTTSPQRGKTRLKTSSSSVAGVVGTDTDKYLWRGAFYGISRSRFFIRSLRVRLEKGGSLLHAVFVYIRCTKQSYLFTRVYKRIREKTIFREKKRKPENSCKQTPRDTVKYRALGMKRSRSRTVRPVWKLRFGRIVSRR